MQVVTNDWDPLEPGGKSAAEQDGEMRHTCPVAHSDTWGGFWSLFRHEDISHAVRDTDTFISAPTQVFPPMDTGAPWLPLQSDPPSHRQYRLPLLPFFRPERVAGFEERLVELTNSLIDDFIDAGEADVAAKLNIPLPAMGMCLLLSLPESNWEHFYRWTTTIIDCSVEGDIDGIRDCFAEISDFANTWVAERREVSKGDVVDAMLQAEIDGRPWTENEIQGTFVLLFSAGHQTTADALSYAMHHLATHPEDRRRLCEHPELIANAVVEFVRLSAPIRALARTTTREVEVNGRTIPEGQPVVMMWGSGSRDEEVFDHPDEFDIDRDNRKHLCFGFGIHRCLGEELARLEISVVLREFLARIPDFELAGDSVQSSWPANGFHNLPIRFPIPS